MDLTSRLRSIVRPAGAPPRELTYEPDIGRYEATIDIDRVADVLGGRVVRGDRQPDDHDDEAGDQQQRGRVVRQPAAEAHAAVVRPVGADDDPRIRWVAAHCRTLRRQPTGVAEYWCLPRDAR